jgi:hypothetical protein
MVVAFFLLLMATVAGTPTSSSSTQPSSVAAARDAKDQAQVQALIGHNDLHLGRLSDALANCDTALRLDPANGTAKDCLNLVDVMLIDRDLNSADVKLFIGDKAGAIVLSSKWVYAGHPCDRRTRAWRILRKARSNRLHRILVTFVPDWIRQILVAIVTVVLLGILLLAARKLWREWERGKWYGTRRKTNWSMLPLRELSAGNIQTGIPTDAILDAFGRLGYELNRTLWQPKLLLIRPTPPANYEPAIISEFISNSLSPLVFVPKAKDLSLEWQLHEVHLDEALQNLQFKAPGGVDIGSVARFVRSLFEWLNAGAPTISGVTETRADRGISIHLAARGGRIKSVLSPRLLTQPLASIPCSFRRNERR